MEERYEEIVWDLKKQNSKKGQSLARKRENQTNIEDGGEHEEGWPQYAHSHSLHKVHH